MDKTSLENSIRNEAEQQILNIARKEAEEIKRLDDAYATEINDFKILIQTQTDDRIKQESSKVENRASLDLKKHNIRSIETFIGNTVEEVTKTIRDNHNYKRFLMDAIIYTISQIPTKAEIHLKIEDLGLEKEIKAALKDKGIGKDVVIMEDNSIKWGGCLTVDVMGGRIFDSTIERIYYRKSLLIRREVMRLLGDSSGDKAKERSCKI